MAACWTIGLVGDAGAGKSTVRAWLEARGVAALDADAIVHRVLERDRAVVEAVAARFGEEVRAAGGGIDRAVLGAIVFGDPAALADLERLVHPVVIRAVEEWLNKVESDVAVVEAVKLVESGLAARLDELWLVMCDRRARQARLAERGWSAAAIADRQAAAPPLAPRLALAGVIIDNSGAPEATERQLEVAWARVRDRLVGALEA